jgi:uncharacterized protein involved in exopolysaccharide biosynthesis
MDFIGFLANRWKLISAIVLLSLLVMFFVTFSLSKQYASYGIVFPANNNSVESIVENPTVGYDLEADRLMQLLQSNEVFDSVVAKFNLINYYGIDKAAPDWRDELREDFVDDVTFVRTQYMSIVITAQTTDPQLSADIVNYIISLSDGIRDRFYKRNLYAAYKSIEKEYFGKKAYVDSLERQLAALRSKTSVDFIVMPNSQYVIQAKSNPGNAQSSTELERVTNLYIFEQFRLNEIAARYEKSKNQYERPVTLIFIVDRAKPSYKKVFPSYTVNLSLAGVLSFAFSIFFLMLSDRMKEARKK